MLLRQMEYFVAAVRCGSLSKAAEKLFLTQPAISQQISLLEKEIGVQLIVRNTKGIQPTPAGTLFYKKAQKILDDTFSAIQLVREQQALVKSVIRIGCIGSFSSMIIPMIAVAYKKAYPHEELITKGIDYAEAEALIAEEAIDLCLVYGRDGSKNPRIAYQPLIEDEVWINIRKSSDLTKKRALSLEDLRGHQLLMIHQGCSDYHDALAAYILENEPLIKLYRTKDEWYTNMYNFVNESLTPCIGAHLLLSRDEAYTCRPLNPRQSIEIGVLFNASKMRRLQRFIDVCAGVFSELQA